MNKRYKGRRRKRLDGTTILFGVLFGIVVASWLVVGKFNYDRKHFAKGTTINGVDCSNMTVEEAKNELENQTVALVFPETFSQAIGRDLGRTIRSTSVLENFLEDQKVQKSGKKEYELKPNDYNVEEETLRRFLERKEEFHNVIPPQNAYVQWDAEGRFLEIVPEVYGKGIPLEEACLFAKKVLLLGETMIDFTSLDAEEAKVKQIDLDLDVQFINDILQSAIEFQFKDGSTYTLDYNTTKEWVSYDENAETYRVDKRKWEEGIAEIVQLLSKKVSNLGTTMEYVTEEGKRTVLPVQWGSYDTLDEKSENEAIRLMLLSGKTYEVEPIYEKVNDIRKFDSYVAISINEQRLRVYENGEVIYDFPVITGTANQNDTPKGVFYSNWRTTNYYLSKSEVWVDYWITVDGNVGIHDADNWRNANEYTKDRYLWDGSHGCINMRRADVITIYNYIEPTTPIIIY